MGITLTIHGTSAKLRRNSAVFITVGKSSKAKLKRGDEEFGWPSFVSDSGRCKLAYFMGVRFRRMSYKYVVPFSGWALKFNGVLYWLNDFEEKLRGTRILNFSFHTRLNKCVHVIGSRELDVLENGFAKALRKFLCQPIVIDIILEFLDPTGFRGVTELPHSMMYREDTALPTEPKLVTDAKSQVEVLVSKLDLKTALSLFVYSKEPFKFWHFEKKLHVECNDTLTMVNGVDVAGFSELKLLKTINDAPKRVIIRLLKPDLQNARIIDQDTIECPVERKYLLSEVTNFCNLKDGVPTFRCNVRPLFFEKGDQLLRVNEEDTTNIQAKDDIIAMIQSCDREVTIWIRKEVKS